MLKLNRRKQNSVKQLSFKKNKKIKAKEVCERERERVCVCVKHNEIQLNTVDPL